MKFLWLDALLLGLLVSTSAVAQSSLPQCPSDTKAVWNNCQGTDTSTDGGKYVGEFRNNRQDGQGTFTWANGTKYVGEFRNGKMNGQGTLTWPDGRKYIGGFSNGSMSGQGSIFAADGKAPAIAVVTKKDILGFFTGVTEEEFIARKEKCLHSDDHCGIYITPRSAQREAWGGISSKLTEKLDQNLVKEIELRFSSGTPPAEMIASISEQYGARPTKSEWNAEIKYATEGHECPYREATSIFDLFACVGGLIAQWRLDGNLSLQLRLNSPAAGTNPNQYVLILSSDAPARLEREVEQNRKKEEEMRVRTINPRQRF